MQPRRSGTLPKVGGLRGVTEQGKEAIVKLGTTIRGPALAAALGSAAGTGVFLIVLDRGIGAGRGGVTAAAWAVLPALDRIRWPDIAVLTGLGAVMVAGGWVRTRKNIRGRRPDELFS